MKKYVLLNTPTVLVGALVFCASSATADSIYPTLDNTAPWRFDSGGYWDTSGSMTYDAGSTSYRLNRTFTYYDDPTGAEYFANVDHTTTIGQETRAPWSPDDGDFLTFTSNLKVGHPEEVSPYNVGYVVDFTGRFSDTPAQYYELGWETDGSDFGLSGDASVQFRLEVDGDVMLPPGIYLHNDSMGSWSFFNADWRGKDWKLSMRYLNYVDHYNDGLFTDEVQSEFKAYLGATESTPIPGPGIAMACAVGLAGIKRRRRRH